MSTDYKHAEQIYAQMLGMVCRPELYNMLEYAARR